MKLKFLVLLLAQVSGVFAAPQADFLLTDINASSIRHQQPISPRQYRGQITAWYFGREW